MEIGLALFGLGGLCILALVLISARYGKSEEEAKQQKETSRRLSRAIRANNRATPRGPNLIRRLRERSKRGGS